MKTFNIFYSWQSDISQNNTIIHVCLESAIRKIIGLDFKYNIDRDTLNSKGTPDIPNTVFRKISDDTDIFIADITIINKRFRTNKNNLKLTPNPNVLLELGFAANAIQWENIICVMNEAFGTPDELPFDMKYRKPLTFNVSEYSSDLATEKEKLINEFEKTIRSLNPNEKRYRLRETEKILVSDNWQSIGKNSIESENWGHSLSLMKSIIFLNSHLRVKLNLLLVIGPASCI